jgi:hypothetical protein
MCSITLYKQLLKYECEWRQFTGLHTFEAIMVLIQLSLHLMHFDSLF